MKNKRNTIAALFDMDGVIVHTNPYHKKAFKMFLDKHDISISDQELKDQYMAGQMQRFFLTSLKTNTHLKRVRSGPMKRRRYSAICIKKMWSLSVVC